MMDIHGELKAAQLKHPTPIRSVAEGLAIVEEEAFELKLECYKSKKDYKALYDELIQLGAMCVRMADDLNLRKKALEPVVAEYKGPEAWSEATLGGHNGW